ncbi:MAG: DUF2062 domain-containing protein [Gammaproteobacteria bacterium]|nr:DUF2062 domain-containing protein [Gammaproteobacteria bacterium]
MPKRFIKKYMPDPHTIREHKSLQMFGSLLHDPNLWHLNRRSVAKAFAVGLFFMMMPVPFQMALAAGAAIIIRSNLPISVILVWISNPITMPPMFYFAYRFGAWILQTPEAEFAFEPTMDWLLNGMTAIWFPFLFGCLLLGTIFSVLGYITIRLLWRLSIVKRINLRKNSRSS